MMLYIPGAADVVEAALALLVFASWLLVGAAIAGRSRHSAFDPLVGWAVLCLPYVLIGTSTTLSFILVDLVCVLIVALAAALCWWRRIGLDAKSWLPYITLSLPFLLMVTPTQAYGWDPISHWLPNAQYIIANQHFPREGLPHAYSMHPGYPYGFALVVYWVEMLARLVHVRVGVVGIPAAENVLLFACAARMLVEQAKTIFERAGTRGTAGFLLFVRNPWLAAGVSLLLVTALSPTFLPSNSLSANADNPTAMALLALAFAIAPSSAGKNVGSLLQLSLILVLLAFLKEDNLALAAALMAGRVAWEARTGQPLSPAIRYIALSSLPMLAVAAIWHVYAYRHIPGGEMAIRPISQWNPSVLPGVLIGMGWILVRKIGYFVMLVAALYLAGRKLVRAERTPESGLLVIAASAFVGYTLFLAFAYVSIFSEGEAARDAAFWRYQTHLGLVLESALVMALGSIGMRPAAIPRWLAAVVCATMLVAPVVMAPVIRPDTDPLYRALRGIGNDLNAHLAGARKMSVVDQFGSGWPCPVFVYEAKGPLNVAPCVTKIAPCITCQINEAAKQSQFVWTNGWSPALTQAIHLSLAPNRAWLLKRTVEGWRPVADWPIVPDKTWKVRPIWAAS